MSGFDLTLADIQKAGTTAPAIIHSAQPLANPNTAQTIMQTGTDWIEVLKLVNNGITQVNQIMDKMQTIKGKGVPEVNRATQPQVYNNPQYWESKESAPAVQETVFNPEQTKLPVVKTKVVELKKPILVNEVFESPEACISFLEKIMAMPEIKSCQLGKLAQFFSEFVSPNPDATIELASLGYAMNKTKIQASIIQEFASGKK